MIRSATGVVGSAGLDAAEFAEIHSLQAELLAPKSRAALKPGEEELSLPPQLRADPKMELLCRALGAAVTTDNPVWRANPIARLRSLQKALIGHSLTLPVEARKTGLDAVRVLESDIRLRLRWQQMARSDSEAPPQLESVKEQQYAA